MKAQHYQVLNLNGTSYNELADQHLCVLHSLIDLQKALARAAPHARDWQTAQRDNTYTGARVEWELAVQDLARIRKWAEGICERLAEQRKD